MTAAPAPKNFHGYLIDVCCMDRFARDHGIRNESVERNLARLYSKAADYYRSMKYRFDLESLFTEGIQRDLFYLFSLAQDADKYGLQIGEGLAEYARSFDHVCIYGAGILAGKVYSVLERENIAVDCFLVTDMENNPRAFRGHRVYALKDSPIPKAKALVVIAVTDGYRAEIESALTTAGYQYVYYKEQR